MRKIVYITILIVSISQLNVFSQNTEEIKIGLNRSYKMEGETFLKEFIIDLKPNQEKEYSVMLDKKTLYAWHTYLVKKNTLEIKLFDSKNNLLFKNEKNDKAIIRFTVKNDQEQLYRLFFKNISKENVTTVAYLTYIDYNKAKPVEASTNIRLKSLLNASKGTYLKDFATKIDPVSTARYSIVLTKNSIYELLFNQDNNQLEVTLYSNEDLISPTIEQIEPEITSRQYTISKTGVYHLFVNNKSSVTSESVVLLSFLGKLYRTEPEEEVITPTSQEENKDLNQSNSEEIYFIVDDMPTFNGKGSDEFRKYIQDNLKYPQEAIDVKAEGRVFVQFTVGRSGYVKDAKIVRGLHPALDQEVLRVVYGSPKWEPGKKDREPADVILTFPVIFKLP